MTRLWILGASDPEMAAIEALLVECGEAVEHATVDGVRVHGGNMYRADSPRHELLWLNGYGAIYAVECSWEHVDGETGDVQHLDHHRPGDPGYGRPPAEFLPASSVGQVIAELARLGVLPVALGARVDGVVLADGTRGQLAPGQLARRTYLQSGCSLHPDGCETGPAWVVGTAAGHWLVPDELVLAAAADHCLGAAYRGECPGVDPDELMAWRAESRAAHQGRTVGEVLADVASAQEALREAPLLTLQGQDHCGPTGLCGCGPDSYGSDSPIASTYYGTGDCYCDCDGCSRPSVTVCDMRRPDPIAELPEAATRLGIGYMSGPLDQPDGRRKFTVSGSAEQVTAWMRWAPEHGLTDIYGDAARGFAGGYEVAL